MSEEFVYVCGSLARPHSTRIFQSVCGNYGKIVRTPTYGYNHYTFGKPRIKYFLWSDDKQEHASIEALRGQSDEYRGKE